MNAASLNVEWSQRRFAELSQNDRDALRDALGRVPCDGGDLRPLWPAVEAGKIGIVTARLASGEIALASFYEVQIYADGTRNFHSVATLALRPEIHGWTQVGMPLMETMAQHYDCRSMSMHTTREGLVHELVQLHGWHKAEVVLRKML